MTTLLETAFEKVSALSESEQNIYAKNILNELAYKNSSEYAMIKKDLEARLADIESGKTALLSHEEVWSTIEAYH
jgi:hypothetical protein